ncbi:MAG: hypothetical protein RIT81_09140 [Deltaproteobacteria bacterium]
MTGRPDTSIVDLHRIAEPVVVVDLVGRGHLVPQSQKAAVPLAVGTTVSVGDTVSLEAGSEARIGEIALGGGRRGRAHAFVREDAFKPSPGREDVPRLLMELRRVEDEIESLGKDPLETSELPSTPYKRAVAREFATLNLCVEDAKTLDEQLARRERAVVVFVSDETAFIATSRVTVPKLILLMTSVRRPVQPHLVEDEVIEELLTRVYGATS